MKSKLFSASTWLLVGLAASAANTAVAETRFVTTTDQPALCADWAFNDSKCAAYIAPSSGNAAYGESSGTMARTKTTPSSCADWSYNDERCPAHVARMEGNAAYGVPTEMTMRSEMIQSSCTDWSYNNSKCAAYIRN